MSSTGFEEMPVKPSSIFQAVPTPAGNLGVLPREIRDEIYGYMLCLNRSNKWHRDSDVYIPPRSLFSKLCFQLGKRVDNRILYVSKGVRQEAIEVLCSQGAFALESRPRFHPDVSVVDPIMNVRMSSRLTRQEEMKGLSLFVGTKVLRKAFVMRIDCIDDEEPRAMTPPLIEVFKQLIGFKTVTFQIYPHIVPSPECLTERRDPEGVPNCCLEADSDTGFNALIAAFRRELEPALGPSTEESLITGDKLATHHDIAVIFHPRDHLSRKKQAARGYQKS